MSKTIKDMTGLKVGNLTVLKDSGERGLKGQVKWLCACDCGNEVVVIGSSLRKTNATKSCGCLQKLKAKETGESITKSLVGKRFGRLVVLKILPINKNKRFAECKCDCGATFLTRTDKIKSGGTISCGCFNREQSSMKKGPLSPSYNREISDEERVFKRTLYKRELSDWRDKVFTRDNFKCAICAKNGYLHAHHLDGYHWCKEKRFDVENGVTLCKKHHLEFHKYYGFKNNTSSQFVEFTESLKEVITK